MKHFFKLFFKLSLLLSVLLLHTSIHAAEREDRWADWTDFGVLVRHLDCNMTIVCNQDGSSSNQPFFMMLHVGDSSAQYIVVDVDTVFDFEVFGHNVYFCGVRSGHGVLGYFSLVGFPSTTVQILDVPTSYRLRRLEVQAMAGQTHMVAVGDGLRGTAEIVDAIDYGTYWDMNFFDAKDSTIVLTDLAITNNYVVISLYNNMSFPNVPDAKVLYLSKPTTYGGTFSPSYNLCKLAMMQAAVNLTIEACEEDAFVVAALSGITLTGYYKACISAFTGTSPYSNIVIKEPTNASVRLRDLEYYNSIPVGHDKITELLLDFEEAQNHRSAIFTLQSGMVSGISTAYGHLFDGIHITSLDKNGSMPDHFWAVGLNKRIYARLEQFKYKYNDWQTCTDYITCTTKPIEKCEGEERLYFIHVNIEQIPLQNDAGGKNIHIDNLCD